MTSPAIRFLLHYKLSFMNILVTTGTRRVYGCQGNLFRGDCRLVLCMTRKAIDLCMFSKQFKSGLLMIERDCIPSLGYMTRCTRVSRIKLITEHPFVNI